MGDLKLFRIENGTVTELLGLAFALEKPLQQLIEQNMETLFGVRFVASEHSTGQKQAGRIDSLGLDENGSPVIFEYKRSVNENVINQGLFYLDWLLDHKAEFELLVMKKLGNNVAEQIDWSSPRLVCVASDFTRYDEHAIAQINRSIELVRYRDYNGEYLTLDLVVSTTASTIITREEGSSRRSSRSTTEKTVTQVLEQVSEDLKNLYDMLDVFLMSMGDDVAKTANKYYFAYRRIKNFACVEIHPQTKKLLIYLKADLLNITLETGFTRDVTNIGHYGTGNLEVTIGSRQTLEKAQPLIISSYQLS
jgi:predicted transport protein